MPAYPKTNDYFKSAHHWIKENNDWKYSSQIYVKNNNIWKPLYSYKWNKVINTTCSHICGREAW